MRGAAGGNRERDSVSVEYRVISIGALSGHPLWGEGPGLRTAHATTTLIRAGSRVIVVDPGLPAAALAARLNERSGLRAEQVTDVFLTNFRPAHRGGLAAFGKAAVWVSEAERESVGRELVAAYEEETDEETREVLRGEIALLRATKGAPDRLAEGVDLFPLPGFTPGGCGLILPLAGSTVVVAGDAVGTGEHLAAGRVLDRPFDAGAARESFREVIEIADVIVPGHDNLLVNPMRGGRF